jgi:hypothetical protein
MVAKNFLVTANSKFNSVSRKKLKTKVFNLNPHGFYTNQTHGIGLKRAITTPPPQITVESGGRGVLSRQP